MGFMTIGQVARGAEIGIETVRFYEREGLIPEPARKESGYRQYPPDTVTRLQFIRRAKDLGFTLKEIKELLALQVDPATSCETIKRRAESKLVDIRRKIEDLQRIENVLVQLTSICPGQGPTSDCPILDSLEVTSSSL